MMMYAYNVNQHHRMTWIDEHCHAEPAIPTNKWVCAEGDVTRVY